MSLISPHLIKTVIVSGPRGADRAGGATPARGGPAVPTVPGEEGQGTEQGDAMSFS